MQWGDWKVCPSQFHLAAECWDSLATQKTRADRFKLSTLLSSGDSKYVVGGGLQGWEETYCLGFFSPKILFKVSQALSYFSEPKSVQRKLQLALSWSMYLLTCYSALKGLGQRGVLRKICPFTFSSYLKKKIQLGLRRKISNLIIFWKVNKRTELRYFDIFSLVIRKCLLKNPVWMT